MHLELEEVLQLPVFTSGVADTIVSFCFTQKDLEWCLGILTSGNSIESSLLSFQFLLGKRSRLFQRILKWEGVVLAFVQSINWHRLKTTKSKALLSSICVPSLDFHWPFLKKRECIVLHHKCFIFLVSHENSFNTFWNSVNHKWQRTETQWTAVSEPLRTSPSRKF